MVLQLKLQSKAKFLGKIKHTILGLLGCKGYVPNYGFKMMYMRYSTQSFEVVSAIHFVKL